MIHVHVLEMVSVLYITSAKIVLFVNLYKHTLASHEALKQLSNYIGTLRIEL